MCIVFYILLFYQILGSYDVPLDRWLVQVKSVESNCLDQWWMEKSFNKDECFKRKLPIHGWYVIKLPRAYSDSLRNLTCIQSIQVDEVLENRNTIPNDVLFPNQANMDLIGMQNAWDLSTGGLSINGDPIVVAVIDNGFQPDHEDLMSLRTDQDISSTKFLVY